MQVCCPNGMDWDQDKNVFYFIDTADAVVRSYPVDENGVPKRSQDGVLLGVKDVSHAFSPVTLLAVRCHAADDPVCILASSLSSQSWVPKLGTLQSQLQTS